MIIWIFTAAEMVKAEEKGKMDQSISLPAEVEGWKWDGKEIKYNSKTLFDYIDGAAELFLAYGFQNLTARRYEKSNQPPITIELYEMGSSEDAYGVFSFERQDEVRRDRPGIGVWGRVAPVLEGKVFCQHLCRRGRSGGRTNPPQDGQDPWTIQSRQQVRSRNYSVLFQARTLGWSIRAFAILKVIFS